MNGCPESLGIYLQESGVVEQPLSTTVTHYAIPSFILLHVV